MDGSQPLSQEATIEDIRIFFYSYTFINIIIDFKKFVQYKN